MTNGFVYVARHPHKWIKGNPCLFYFKTPIYPTYFKHFYSIAKWKDCFILNRTILSIIPADEHIRDNFYNITIDNLRDIILEYSNFLSKWEWDDERSCNWKEHKAVIKHNYRQLIKMYLFMKIYNNEGRLFYFYQKN